MLFMSTCIVYNIQSSSTYINHAVSWFTQLPRRYLFQVCLYCRYILLLLLPCMSRTFYQGKIIFIYIPCTVFAVFASHSSNSKLFANCLKFTYRKLKALATSIWTIEAVACGCTVRWRYVFVVINISTWMYSSCSQFTPHSTPWYSYQCRSLKICLLTSHY